MDDYITYASSPSSCSFRPFSPFRPIPSPTSPVSSDVLSLSDPGRLEEAESDDYSPVILLPTSPTPSVDLLCLESLSDVIKESLPGHIRNSSWGHYVRGKISASDKKSLYSYAARVGELTLGKEPDDILPHAFVRLAQFQDPNKPLFSSLYRLRIVTSSSSLDFLPVLLSGALTTLELTAFSDDGLYYSSVVSFLECAIDEAPNLSTLILGPGLIVDEILDVCLTHKNLRRLELLDVRISITDKLLQDIGSLSSLETFVFRDDGSSTYTLSQHGIVAGKSTGSSLGSVVSRVVRTATPFQSPDLVRRALSCESEAASDDTQVVDSSLFPSLRKFEVRGQVSMIEALVDVSSDMEELSVDFSDVLKRMRKDVKKAKRFATAIATLLKDSIEKWHNTLMSVSIKGDHTTKFSMPSDVFATLLLGPHMKHLEITGIDIDMMETTLYRLKGVDRKLEELLLPVHSTATGLTPARLRVIAEACPRLKIVRCRLWNLSLLSISSPLSHKLETLSVSSQEVGPGRELLCKIARYLDSIFPNLKSITCHGNGNNAEDWCFISHLVNYFQAVRMDEVQRLGFYSYRQNARPLRNFRQVGPISYKQPFLVKRVDHPTLLS